MKKMKVLRKKFSEKGLWIDEIDCPKISANEVLLRVKKTAICGTDLHIYNWDEWSRKQVKIPTVLGHEFAGEVIKTGELVQDLRVGERVSAEGHLVCGRCRNCLAGKKHLCSFTKGLGIHVNGAFAEFVKVPRENIYRIPDTIKDEEAAIFDPFGNAVFSVSKADISGEDVLVTGAGPVGCLTALLCSYLGARHIVITDVNPYRLNLLKSIPRVTPINTNETSLDKILNLLKIKEGFDVSFEMSGNKHALDDIIKFTRHGGEVINLGVFSSKTEIDINSIIFKSLTLHGVYGREIFETWYKMVSYIETGLNIRSFITHSFNFYDFEEAFQLLNHGKACKVILEWS